MDALVRLKETHAERAAESSGGELPILGVSGVTDASFLNANASPTPAHGAVGVPITNITSPAAVEKLVSQRDSPIPAKDAATRGQAGRSEQPIGDLPPTNLAAKVTTGNAVQKNVASVPGKKNKQKVTAVNVPQPGKSKTVTQDGSSVTSKNVIPEGKAPQKATSPAGNIELPQKVAKPPGGSPVQGGTVPAGASAAGGGVMAAPATNVIEKSTAGSVKAAGPALEGKTKTKTVDSNASPDVLPQKVKAISDRQNPGAGAGVANLPGKDSTVQSAVRSTEKQESVSRGV